MRGIRFTDVFAALASARSQARSAAQRVGLSHPPVHSVSYVELLEIRRLFTVNASIVNNVLVVTGTTSGDALTVYQIDAATDQVFVDLNGGGDDAGPFAVNTFNSISVTGGAGPDKLVVESTSQPDTLMGQMSVTKPAVIKGGDGDDTLWGGDGNDTIWGEEGSDQIRGHGGNDGAYGGYGGVGTETGNDILNGGTGTDTLWGEGGDDQILAEDGNGENDQINGGDGTDVGFVDNDDIVTNVETTF